MKKKVTALCLCVALLAVAVVGASLAYFTDTKSATNTFTVGNVSIKLIESKLHRQGSGGTGDTSIPTPGQTASGMKYISDGTKAFTDAEIQADAETYATDYLAVKGENMVPGRRVAKSPYVINTGANDAYIRIRVMIPADLDTAVLNSSMYTSSAMDKEFTMAYDHTGTVDREGIKYNVYTFTRIDPLAPNEMTYWNVWGTIHMDTTVTSAQSEELFGENGHYPNGVFPVLVEADAIQAEGFADAAAAWTAFAAQA